MQPQDVIVLLRQGKLPYEESIMAEPNAEDVYRMGAEAMKSKITAWLMMKGETELAILVLQVSPPPFSEPEKVEIKAT
jgi:hypothetical protein